MTIVALRALGLGDLCTAVPALRALVRHAGNDERVILAGSPALWPLYPYIDDRLEIVGQEDLRHELPAVARHARLAVNLHGRGPQSTALLRRAAPREIVAFADVEVDDHARPRIPWREQDHDRLRWCRLLDAHGIRTDPADLHFQPRSTAGSGDVAVVHPGASAPARRWPHDRWARVVEHLVASGLRVALTGGHHERSLCNRIMEDAIAPSGTVRVRAGETEVDDLAELVAAAPLVVSGDTGVAHLAFAFARPSVTLYGPISPDLWGPPDLQVHRALWHTGDRGDPHAARPDERLLRIAVEEVVIACRQKLDAHASRRVDVGVQTGTTRVVRRASGPAGPSVIPLSPAG